MLILSFRRTVTIKSLNKHLITQIIQGPKQNFFCYTKHPTIMITETFIN